MVYRVMKCFDVNRSAKTFLLNLIHVEADMISEHIGTNI